MTIWIIENHYTTLIGIESSIKPFLDSKTSIHRFSSPIKAESCWNYNSKGIVICDLDFEDSFDTFSFLTRVNQDYPQLHIIVYTTYSDLLTYKKSIKCNISSYITKASQISELITAIKEIQQNGAYHSKSMNQIIDRANYIDNSYFRGPQSAFKLLHLSTKEREVAKLVKDLKSYSEIAKELKISINSVKVYIQRIYDKLQLPQDKRNKDYLILFFSKHLKD